MQFQHNGETYRIGFTYERPRDWSYHRDHKVELVAPLDRNGRELPGAYLWCLKCATPLSGPDAAKRNCACAIEMYRDGEWHFTSRSGHGQPQCDFQRVVGRHTALLRALSGAPADFADAAWTAFFRGSPRGRKYAEETLRGREPAIQHLRKLAWLASHEPTPRKRRQARKGGAV